jgi:transposase
MRSGGEYFTEPAEPAQRRYEALRCYFVEELSASEVAARFGYTPAVVHQMASELRSGRAQFFASSKPGPKGPRKTARIRDRVLELRASERSVSEIAQALSAEGTPVSAQTVWSILASEGLERLERRPAAERGAPTPRLEPVKARAIPSWPAGLQLPCDHAGLFLLVPGIVELGLHELASSCGYPSTKALDAWHSLGSLLLAKCARKPRVSHTHALADDDALGLLLGLTALPKATHLTSYSYRVRRTSNEQLLTSLTRRLRELGLATGEQGFNLDFHAIRHHGTDTPLEKHYVPRRSQRTRAMLTFFAQDHASTEMVYANADLTKAEQAREIIAFADYWHNVAGEDPGLLVFDSKLTTYKVLSELTERGIRWLTLRERGPKLMRDLAALPASQWNTVRVERSGRYRQPEIHDQLVRIKDIEAPVRQLAVRNIGREQPTLLITNDIERTTKQLFARYAERMGIENELDAYISGFHLDALSSGLPLNVDLDTTLTSSPATSTGCSPDSSPATSTPPPTASGATSSTAPARCTSARTHSPSNSARAPTTPSSSTPASPSKPPRSPGSTAAIYGSASRPAETSTSLSYR